MLRRLFAQGTASDPAPLEGDLYKRITAFGKTFELCYGYYEDFERQHNDPMPIYPDFRKHPVYTEDGAPFVTQMQDACIHYAGNAAVDPDCASCKHFCHGEELLGICICGKNLNTGGEDL